MGLKIKQLNVWVPDFHILTDVTMTALHGQFMAIMGPSGAGKSTLLDFMVSAMCMNVKLHCSHTILFSMYVLCSLDVEITRLEESSKHRYCLAFFFFPSTS
jgi:ABC-type uncharacterized transport system YnjBCD ATPase subunit